MLTRNLQLTIACLVLSAWTGSSSFERIKFGLNIVYTARGEECSGPLPKLNLSTRTFFVFGNSLMASHRWDIIQAYKGNCSNQQNQSLITFVSSVRQTVAEYQFRIQLSSGDPCHCVTLESATNDFGLAIKQEWDNGNFWCSNNSTFLCASINGNGKFYSKRLLPNGTPSTNENACYTAGSTHGDRSNGVKVCPESTSTSIVDTQTTPISVIITTTPTSMIITATSTSVIITATPTPTSTPDLLLACPKDGNWRKSLNCTIISDGTGPTNAGCANNSNAVRVCHCNGRWGPVHCHASLQLVQELIEVSPKEALMKLLELPPDIVGDTQRRELLMSAYNRENYITVQFVKIFLEVFASLSLETVPVPDLLLILDRLALDLRLNVTINVTGIVLVVQEVFPGSGHTLGVQVEGSYISLPGELFKNLKKSEFIASFFFQNISHVLPGGDPISPVISSILSCKDCHTSNLSENVTVFFPLPKRMSDNITCGFANLQQGVGPNFWNESGCETTSFDNGSVLCSCNHLTHFAILLSPAGNNMVDQVHIRVLSVTGYVFVSISLVFLLLTILTYVLQRSLWNMRNYIHIMLCANLFAAQLLFVVGVERTENEAVCSAIAVLLHYMWLVVFMWMLMEGVVLYVTLVKVFVTHTKRYIAAFTVASYGIPLAYMAVVAPIGFLVNTDRNITGHYGVYRNNTETSEGEQLHACWLNVDTNFVWAFIAPVVVIILCNIGFLVMTLVIMYRHLKRQETKPKVATVKHWIKVVISLTVVMGITWIGNLLFFTEELLFVAYIMTIFIAGQGIIIFILLVPLSKQVREAYLKWWRVRQSHLSFLNKIFPTKGTTLPYQSTLPDKPPCANENVYGNIKLGTFESDNNQNIVVRLSSEAADNLLKDNDSAKGSTNSDDNSGVHNLK